MFNGFNPLFIDFYHMDSDYAKNFFLDIVL